MMAGLIEMLKSMNQKDTKVRAVLRRSLAFEPGRYAPAFPYVERVVGDDDNPWRREMLYLVAGLWAWHWREGQGGQSVSLGKACADYYAATGFSPSVERRFIALLDADQDQLPYRLRQMVSLLKDHPIDFESLLKGLVYWDGDRKRTQNAWAREFYKDRADIAENE